MMIWWSRNIIINVENSCAASYYYGNRDALPFKKFGVSKIFFFKEIITFLQRRIKLFKSGSKDIYSISNKHCSFLT